jgi:hypothetical protein
MSPLTWIFLLLHFLTAGRGLSERQFWLYHPPFTFVILKGIPCSWIKANLRNKAYMVWPMLISPVQCFSTDGDLAFQRTFGHVCTTPLSGWRPGMLVQIM